jgi:hypothetical protein
VLAALSAPVANAAWTRPSVLVTGDDAGLLDTAARPDGSLRAAIVDSRRGIAMGLVDGAGGASFGDPLVALRSPALVAQVALAADGSGVALVAFRDPGAATLGAPVRAGYATTEHTLVSAGVGDSGEAVVAWQTNGFPSDLAAAVRLPGAGFSTARFVSRDAGYAQLAVGPGGQAILAADRGAGLDVSVKPPGADAMPAARRVDRGQGYAVGVAAAGPGAVAAAWLAAPRQRGPAQVRVYGGDGRLRRIGAVGRNALGENVEVAIDGAGATVVSWEEALRSKRGDPTARSHLAVAYRRPGGRLGAVRYFGPVSLDDSPESVRLGPAGRAWVLYEAFEPGDFGDRAGYRRVYVTDRRP